MLFNLCEPCFVLVEVQSLIELSQVRTPLINGGHNLVSRPCSTLCHSLSKT